MTPRLYPLGIQTYSEIRERHLLYIDKTEYIYRMTHGNMKYVFLTRPRRFGKSLLASTLKCYFEGKKSLFEGLAIEKLETEWVQHPVLHFSLAGGKYMEKDALERYLDEMLKVEERKWGIENRIVDANNRLAHLIRTACEKSGKKVVVIIDEYDAPLLDVVHEDQHLVQLRNTMRNFYSPLKDADPYLRFVFLTGITKFSQVSIFSELNNINNISMLPEYAGLCGITLDEIETQMQVDVEYLGKRLGNTYEETMEALRSNYDGYHFAWPSPDVFNPFSLLAALSNGNLDAYWFSTGTPTYLLEMMKKFNTQPSEIRLIEANKDEFDAPTENMTSLTPLLYQSGYLTIKNYNKDFDFYTLDIPNKEVRTGLTRALIPSYVSPNTIATTNTARRLAICLVKDENMGEALRLLQDFLASVPYCNVKNHEGHYQQMLYVVFSLLTPYMVDVEVHTPHGRIDMVVMTHTRIFIIEFKLNRDAKTALHQINLKNYGKRFALSALPVTKVGVNFDSEKGNITDWVIE